MQGRNKPSARTFSARFASIGNKPLTLKRRRGRVVLRLALSTNARVKLTITRRGHKRVVPTRRIAVNADFVLKIATGRYSVALEASAREPRGTRRVYSCAKTGLRLA